MVSKQAIASPGGGAYPAVTGGHRRRRHHHHGDDRRATRRPCLYRGDAQSVIAVALVEHPLIDVILLGGTMFKHSVVTVGAETLAAMARINADLFFMGVTGVAPAGGLYHR